MKPTQDDLAFLQTWLPHLASLYTTAQAATFTEQLEHVVATYTALVPPEIVALLQHQTYVTAQGTILVADVTGFTALSTQLSQQGRAGSEELSVLINQLLEVLIHTLFEYGGTILQFSGDAITTLFNQNQLGDQHALFACAAAAALQQKMEAWQTVKTSSDRVHIQLRTTLEHGTTLFMRGQAHERSQLLMTGAALLKAHTAQKSVAPATVIGCMQLVQTTGAQYWREHAQGIWELADASLFDSIKPVSHTQFPQTAPDPFITLRLLQPYIPHFVVQRLNTGLVAQYGEFRPVSVVFNTFFPTELFEYLLTQQETTQAYEYINQLFMRLYSTTVSIVEQYGGQINKLDVGDHGHRCIILFGAPVAHEDDAQRAVQAALDLQLAFAWLDEELQKMFPKDPPQLAQFGAGIASGVVFAGTVGSTERYEYTVLGSAVNLASRLHDQASNQVLIDQTTRNIVYAHFDFGERETLSLKGINTPVVVTPVLHTREYERFGVLRHTPMIGRKKERTQINSVLRTVVDQHQTHVMLIMGGPGTGKSRLLEEVIIKAQQLMPHDHVVYLTCQSFEQHVPYALMRTLLQRSPLFSSLLATKQYDQIVLLLGPWSRFMPLLNDILDLDIPETTLTRALPPDQRRQRLQDVMLHLLQALHPLCIAINEWQWADASSQAILDQAVQTFQTIPVLFAFVQRETDEIASTWTAQSNLHVVELGPLDSEESLELATRLLKAAPPAELIPLIEQTGGLPLYIEELIQHLFDTQLLEQSQGSWRLRSDVQPSFIPVQHEQLIHARLDRLEQQTRYTAQVASVLGYEFESPWLKAFTQEPALAVKELADIHLIQSLTITQYQFRSKLLRDTIYQSLLFAQRHKLHLQAAHYLEHLYEDYPIHILPILAYHYRYTQDYHLAATMLLKAGQQAQKQYANLEARELYAQAFRIFEQEAVDPETLDQDLVKQLQLNYADILVLTGDYEQARQLYLDTLAKLQLSAYEQASVMRRIGTIYEQQTEWVLATNWLADANERLEGLDATQAVQQEQARVNSALGWIYFRQGQLEIAQMYLNVALSQAQASQDIHEAASILNRLGGVAWSMGNYQQAYEYVQQSLEYSRQTQDLLAEAKALSNLGILTTQQNQLALAGGFLEKAYKLEEHIGNIISRTIIEVNISRNLYFQGQFERALHHIAHALDTFYSLKDTVSIMLALINQAQIQEALGLYTQAEESIEECLQLAQQLERPLTEIEALIIKAHIMISQKQLEFATSVSSSIQEKPLVHQDEEQSGKFQRLQAQLAWAQGKHKQALVLIQDNIIYFNQVGLKNEAKISQLLYHKWQDTAIL